MRPVDSFPNIPDCFFHSVETHPQTLVYRQLRADGGALERTYAEVGVRVQRLAAFLRSLGVTKGSRVAILSGTRSEWMEADLAILLAGGATVSIYQSLPAHDVAYILFDSGADVVFAENQEQVEKLLWAHQRAVEMAGTEDRPAQSATLQLTRIVCFEEASRHEIVSSFRELTNTTAALASSTRDELGGDDVAALVYTSGTTGPPKGVIQTHRNHLANVRQAFDSGMVNERSSIVLFLPLAHSFAKLMGYIGFLTPVTIVFPAVNDTKSSRVDPQRVLRDIRSAGAKIVPVVPRFLEKMKEGIESTSRKSGVKARMLALTLRTALSVYQKQAARRLPGLIERAVFDGTAGLRRKVRQQLFGDEFILAVSGGAKLPVDVAVFFDALGIEILEGYGLTETCVATNVNPLGRKKIGTVGPVLSSDIEMKVSADGEVMFRGPNITQGYWKRPTATRACWDNDGWFHTGDLGSIDADGYLSIVGRKKEIIVTSGGKKIAPAAIEERLCSLPLVSQAVLIGDGHPFCVALLTPDKQAVLDWAQSAPDSSEAGLHAAVRRGVEEINAGLSSFETVKNVLLLQEEFTLDNGLLTPTFKVKRRAVEERYSAQIAQLYRDTKKS